MKDAVHMPTKRDWIVRMECRVIRGVYVEGCTKAQAHDNPFDHAIDEQDRDMIDWEVVSVQPNE